MIPIGWSLAVSAGLFAAGILTLTIHRSAIGSSWEWFP